MYPSPDSVSVGPRSEQMLTELIPFFLMQSAVGLMNAPKVWDCVYEKHRRYIAFPFTTRRHPLFRSESAALSFCPVSGPCPYKGKPAPPKLTTRSQREFRTLLRQGAQKGPNFAGHYTVVEWGCGSNCVVFAIVDAANGKVYDRDMPPINDQYPCGLLYRLESRLFVVEKSSAPNGNCEARLYTWNGIRFVPVQDSRR